MSLLTRDRLEEIFYQSRLRQERKKRREQEKRKEEKRLQRILDKNALKSERDKVMDNLSKLLKKTPQKPLKYVLKPFYVSYHMCEPNENDLYQSWYEIREAEERCEGRLNWDVLQKIIEDTKKMINRL